jgi:hypothetical protein
LESEGNESVTANDWDLIDNTRSWCLCTAGRTDHHYIAATVIATDGAEQLVLAHRNSLGSERVRYNADCPDAAHDQLGELPLEFVKRIAISQRTHRQKGTANDDA